MVRGVHHPEKLEGLQRQQFWVLGALTCGPRRMSDLAERAQTSQTSLTGIASRSASLSSACEAIPIGASSKCG
jgi:hypothetical protein